MAGSALANLGEPMQSITQRLGPPDQMVRHQNMAVWLLNDGKILYIVTFNEKQQSVYELMKAANPGETTLSGQDVSIFVGGQLANIPNQVEIEVIEGDAPFTFCGREMVFSRHAKSYIIKDYNVLIVSDRGANPSVLALNKQGVEMINKMEQGTQRAPAEGQGTEGAATDNAQPNANAGNATGNESAAGGGNATGEQ